MTFSRLEGEMHFVTPEREFFGEQLCLCAFAASIGTFYSYKKIVLHLVGFVNVPVFCRKSEICSKLKTFRTSGKIIL
jgi:hypothetical protein